MILRFADIELDLAKAELRRAGARRSLSALSLALLDYLIRERARVVSRDELLAEVWRGVTVSEGSLRQAISELRRVLDDTGEQQRLIRTVRGRGYRFVGALHAEPVAPILKETAPPRICFGRVAELERVGTLLDDVSAGAGRSCVLFGPPGIGKSCLARELVRVARARRLTTVEGYADPDGVAPAFWPWLQVFTDYFELCDVASRARYEALSPAAFRLLHGARGGGGGHPPGPLGTATTPDGFKLLAELGRLFVALAGQFPGLVLLEDLQWADRSSLLLLAHVARLMPRTRSLLLLTCREIPARENRPLARALDAVERSGVGELLPLGNLSLDDVSSVVEAHATCEASRALSVDVHELSGGNPLFALQLARLLARPGHDQRLTQERPELQLVIHRRLLGLPERAQAAVRAASVLSPSFALAQLAALLEEPPQLALERLEVCIEQGVMVEAKEAARFKFVHPLLREAAYATLSRAERARLHGMAGDWLERHAQHRGAQRLNELAHHFFIAAPSQPTTGRAVYYALRCAEIACRSAAYADALSHYDRALICAELDPASEPRDKLELALVRAEIWRATGADATRVNEHFLALSEQASALGDAQLFTRAVLGYLGQRGSRYRPTCFLLSSDPRDTVPLQRALDQLGDEPSEAQVLVLCSLVHELTCSNDRARREQLAAHPLERARTRR